MNDSFEQWWMEDGCAFANHYPKDIAAAAWEAGEANMRKALESLVKASEKLDERLTWFPESKT